METPTISCLAELGMDHSFINNWSMNSFDELSTIASMASTYDNDHLNVHSSHQPAHVLLSQHKHYMDLSPNEAYIINRPIKQQKSSSWSTNSSSSCDHISTPPQAAVNSPANFHVVNSSYSSNPEYYVPVVKPKEETKSSFTVNFAPGMMFSHGSSYDDQDQNYVYKASQGAKRVTTINPRLSHAQAQDHIIAERKRREKLSQRFIAMSALLPGLKKMDKASVLGDAIKHIKQLQEKVTALEEASKKSIETLLFVRKNRICEDGNDFSSEGNFSDGPCDVPLPQIEAKFCKKDILIRVHCEKVKGIQETAVAEIEKLHLSVTNSCALTFGDSTLDITIIAKIMDEQFTMPIKDLVMHLHSALKKFMM